jgi:hypothetical protein
VPRVCGMHTLAVYVTSSDRSPDATCSGSTERGTDNAPIGEAPRAARDTARAAGALLQAAAALPQPPALHLHLSGSREPRSWVELARSCTIRRAALCSASVSLGGISGVMTQHMRSCFARSAVRRAWRGCGRRAAYYLRARSARRRGQRRWRGVAAAQRMLCRPHVSPQRLTLPPERALMGNGVCDSMETAARRDAGLHGPASDVDSR